MGRQWIGNAGERLGGVEARTSAGPEVGGRDDVIVRRWPRPDFAKAARDGTTTPQRAALFMALRDNLSYRPPAVVVDGVDPEAWVGFWRESVDATRLVWEEGLGTDLANVRALHDGLISRDHAGDGQASNAVLGTGRVRTFRPGRGMPPITYLTHGYDMSDVNAVRERWTARLGWPGERRFADDDAFGVIATLHEGLRVFQPVQGSGKSLMPIGLGRHPDAAGAEKELRELMARAFAERDGDASIGLGDKAMGRRGVRIGPDNPRRTNGNAKASDLVSALGMRGIEFGAYVGQKERQAVVNHTFDAFFDLCSILRLPAAGASFWGRAGLAFGSRGGAVPGASGHFEPGSWVVHLDRSGGAGVVAHEMGHALDAALAEAAGCARGVLLTEAVAAGWRGDTMAGLVAEISAATHRGRDGDESAFLRDARSLERGSRLYWTTPWEMFARLFEVWVYDTLAAQGRRNDFLVFPEAAPDHRAGLERRIIASPYPKGAERAAMTRTMGEVMKVAIPILVGRLGR
jgi:hypothetical protein